MKILYLDKLILLQNLLLLFYRLVGRVVLKHRLFTLINLSSIALGVGVVAAIHLSNRSAVESFRSTVRLVSGQADLEIRGRIPDHIITKIQSIEGIQEATPVFEFIATTPDVKTGWIRILGIDPFASGKLRPYKLTAPNGSNPDLEKWFTNPNSIAVFPDLHKITDNNIFSGEKPIRVHTPKGTKNLYPSFLIHSALPINSGTNANYAFMDIAWAQELADSVGYLTSIQIILHPETPKEIITQKLQAILPADVIVQPPARRSQQMEKMVAAFQTNLSALSMVSLLVGSYLIYNTVSASVLRRRTEIGILRAIGTNKSFLQGIFLAEAALAGLIGGLLGALLALPVGKLLAKLTTQTITSLYTPLNPAPTSLTPLEVGLCLSLGISTALIAAWFPSREATTVDPKQALHPGHLATHAEPKFRSHLILGSCLLASSLAFSLFGIQFCNGWLGFCSAFTLLLGISLIIPFCLTKITTAFANAFLQKTPLLNLGAKNLVRSLYRNSITIAALAAALAMLVSIAVMIHSFRKSVQQWLDHTLLADFYLAPAVNEIAGPQAFLPDSLFSTIQTNESVKLLTKFREIPIVYNNLPASLVILDGPARGKLVLLDKEPPPASDRLKQENAALISESFAQRFQVHKGQKISLPLPNGQQLFEIAGVFRDYTRDSGTIMISLDNYVRNGGNSQAHSLAIYLKQGTNFAQFHAFLNRLAESSLPISIYSNLQLKQRVGEIFDSTFAVTEVLRLVAIVVAISGVLFSFGILIRERSWEIALLRAIGASRSQITLLVLAESAALGLAASFFGIIGGASLALVLTYVINKAFFGWTINLLYPLPFLSTIPLWVTSLALLAALFPAWKAAQIQPAEALRLE